jgi:hypothetical protein
VVQLSIPGVVTTGILAFIASWNSYMLPLFVLNNERSYTLPLGVQSFASQYSVDTARVLAFSLSYWFFSVNRATLLWFPLWVMLARWGTWRPVSRGAATVHRALVVAAFALSCVLLVWWCWLFFTGHWAS